MLTKLERLSSSTKPVTQECKGGNHDWEDFPGIASGMEEEGVGSRFLFLERGQWREGGLYYQFLLFVRPWK